jgi:hyperosmotically inducible periplasmic protein
MRQHRRRSVVCGLALASALLIPFAQAGAQTPSDNTKVNQRDRATGATTADQQKENAADRAITQKIRRAVVEDKTLSTYAHNVKIVSQNGEVTLKGPVRTADEKKNVEAKAVAVAGAGHVTNQISIAPVKASPK